MKVFLFLLSILIAPVVMADWGPMGYGTHHMGYMGTGGLSMLLMILFWGAIVFLAIWLFGGRNFRGTLRTREEDPAQIVKRRYAKGEISEAEMRTMIDTLK